MAILSEGAPPDATEGQGNPYAAPPRQYRLTNILDLRSPRCLTSRGGVLRISAPGAGQTKHTQETPPIAA